MDEQKLGENSNPEITPVFEAKTAPKSEELPVSKAEIKSALGTNIAKTPSDANSTELDQNASDEALAENEVDAMNANLDQTSAETKPSEEIPLGEDTAKTEPAESENAQGSNSAENDAETATEEVAENLAEGNQDGNAKNTKADNYFGGNPFEQSAMEFKRAEDNYFAQISALEKEKSEEEEKIKISQVEQAELQKEKEIAEREARLRLQKEDLKKREEEIKQAEQEQRNKIEAEKRAKFEAEEAERKRKEQQEERLKKLEEEEKIQQRKLAELEMLEKKKDEQLREIVPDNPDMDTIEQEKKQNQVATKKPELGSQDAPKPKKKLPFGIKFLIGIVCVATLGVLGYIGISALIKPVPNRTLIGAELHLEYTDYFEGDEIFELNNKSYNYILATYSDDSKEKVVIDHSMIQSEFITKINNSTFISIFENLTETQDLDFEVVYGGMKISQQIKVHPIEEIGLNLNLRFSPSNVFDEFDFVKYDDVMVEANLADGRQKILTRLQYNLYVESPTKTLEVQKKDEYFQMPSLLDFGIYDPSATLASKIKLNGVAETFTQPTIAKETTLNQTEVSYVKTNISYVEFHTLNIYETYTAGVCKKDSRKHLYQILNAGVFAVMNNNSRSQIELQCIFNYVNIVEGTDALYLVEVEEQGANHNLKLTKLSDTSTLPENLDARKYFTISDFDFNANTSSLTYDIEETTEQATTSIKLISWADNSKKYSLTTFIKLDNVASGEILENATYGGDIAKGAIIDISGLNFKVKYIMTSGAELVYNNQTNTIETVNGVSKNIDLNAIEAYIDKFKPKIRIYEAPGEMRAYSYAHNETTGVDEFVFGYGGNGIGSPVKIYLTCRLYKGHGFASSLPLMFITTSEPLHE